MVARSEKWCAEVLHDANAGGRQAVAAGHEPLVRHPIYPSLQTVTMQLNRERRLIFLRKDVVVRRLQTPGGYARASLLGWRKICGAVASLSTAWIRLNATGWSLRDGAENFSLDSLCPTGWASPLNYGPSTGAKNQCPPRQAAGARAMSLGAFRHPGSPGGTLTKMRWRRPSGIFIPMVRWHARLSACVRMATRLRHLGAGGGVRSVRGIRRDGSGSRRCMRWRCARAS